jgi:hypothetical protein
MWKYNDDKCVWFQNSHHICFQNCCCMHVSFFCLMFQSQCVAAWRALLCFAITHIVDTSWWFVVHTCTLVSSEDYQVIWFKWDLSLNSSFYPWSYLLMRKLLAIAYMLVCKETMVLTCFSPCLLNVFCTCIITICMSEVSLCDLTGCSVHLSVFLVTCWC